MAKDKENSANTKTFLLLLDKVVNRLAAAVVMVHVLGVIAVIHDVRDDLLNGIDPFQPLAVRS